MSIENTNTPNGGSKINSDEGIVINFASMSELNPEKEIVEQVDGKATATMVNEGDYKSIAIGDAKYSDLTIRVGKVGPKLKQTPENKANIKKAMEEFKKEFKGKGAMSFEEYLKYSKENAEREDKISSNKREDSLGDNNR